MTKRLLVLILALLVALGLGQTNRNLGGGLNGIGVAPLNRAFVDAMKEAGDFVSLRSGNPLANVDANGWPTEDCWVQVQWIWDNSAHAFNGTYKLSFTGKALLTSWGGVSFQNQVYEAATNKTTADVVVNFSEDVADFTFFTIVFNNTVGGVKDVKLLRPGYSEAQAAGFTTSFKNHIVRFPVFRFMDWTHANGTTAVNWADRTPVGWPSYATRQGVPWEVCIDLCNELDRDIWINVPIAASDAYVTSLANLLRTRLESSRKIYIENSNEVWNGGFPQYKTNYDAAVAEVKAGGSNLNYPGETEGSSGHFWALRRYARRLMQIRNLFAGVLGESAFGTRFFPVFSNQVAWTETHRQGLEYIERFYGKPSKFFSAIAGAPYFNMGSADANPTLTSGQVLDALEASVNSYNDRFDFKELHRMIALGVFYNLRVFAYEGGPDTFGPNNVAAKRAASLDPRIRTICTKYLGDWYRNGGELFMWFTAGAGTYDSDYGTWPLTNDPDRTDAPKILAMDDVLNAARPAVTAGKLLPAVQDAREWVGCDRNWATQNPYLRDLDSGRIVDFLVRSSGARSYKMTIEAAAPAAGSQVEVWANDTLLTTQTLSATGGWEIFKSNPAIVIPMKDGLNVVRLRVVTGRSFNVKTLTFVNATVKPNAPTNLVATGGLRQISLTWIAPSGSGLTYNVYRSTVAGSYAAKPVFRAITTPSFVDTGVLPGQRTYYRVAAVNSAGESDKSNEASAIATGSARVR